MNKHEMFKISKITEATPFLYNESQGIKQLEDKD